jgi:hypothetical protein
VGEFLGCLSKADADLGPSTPASSLLQKKTDYTSPTIQADAGDLLKRLSVLTV